MLSATGDGMVAYACSLATAIAGHACCRSLGSAVHQWLPHLTNIISVMSGHCHCHCIASLACDANGVCCATVGREIADADPSAWSYVQLGEALMRIQSPEAAIGAFEAALQLQPGA
jgi:hypothetical protein